MCSTPEYRTLISLNDDLTLAVQNNLVPLSVKLVANCLISPGNASCLRNQLHSVTNRAADLVKLIQDKVQLNSKHYHTFIRVLGSEGQEYKDILRKLQEVYQQHNSNHQQPVSQSQVPTNISETGVDIKQRHILRIEADDAKGEVNVRSNVRLTRQDSQSHSIAHAGQLPSHISKCMLYIGGFVLLVGVAVAGALYCYGQWQPGLERGRDIQRKEFDYTKIESSRILFQELEEIGSWEHLCHNLGVSTATVNSLNYERAQNTEKKRRCLEAFYKEDTEPGVQVCWETVIKAVARYPISNRKLAKKIASKYNINIAK